MAEALVLRVAKLLDDFPKDRQLRSLGGEFDELKKTVSSLQKVVPDAEEGSRRNKEITIWLCDLKHAFYDAEDLLEELNIEVAQRESLSKYEKLKQQVSPSSSHSSKHDLGLKMSDRASNIRKRIEAIATRGRSRLYLRELAEDVQVERGSRSRKRSDSFVYDEEIIGREVAKREIMNFLLDSGTEEKISVLSIHGLSGIGKTALARCLYEDDTVKKHFDLRVWAHVGCDFCNIERELRKARGQEATERADGMLQLQKYLLVIDNLLAVDPERWGRLKSLLMGGAQGSKILITTDDQSIADRTSTTPSYCLEALPEESSFDLLMRMACQEEEETRNPIKVDIGRQIVEMCRRIPLAIRMIGSLLFFKKTEAEWSNFKDEISKIHRSYAILRSIIQLSYDYLPCHLKECFAFCSLFPRDWVIDKQVLTSLWIAEGFIQPINKEDLDMEDIAHEYFMDLLWRNFFQDCTKDELGNVMSCKMHDLVSDLSFEVTISEYSLQTPFSLECPLSHQSIDERIRHLSFRSNLRSFMESRGLPLALDRAKYLRTFIKMDPTKTGRCGTQMDEQILCAVISSFKLLRVLDWHDSDIEILPSSICEVRFLTFLDLSENEGIIRLPDSITSLQLLKVLKLNMCYKLGELPSDIRRLVKLRQLEISNCNALSYMPQGMGELTLLHTLTDFILPGDDACPKNYGGLGELNRLNNLRGSLRIDIKGEIKDAVAESNAANLKEKNSLVSLVLVCAGKENDEVLLKELQPSLKLQSLEIRGYGGTRFPSWMSCMPKLVQLRLFDCAGCKSLPSLGELTSLKHLVIGELPIVEYTESDIHALSSLPNLSSLKIGQCPNLEWIPPLLHLKELKLHRFPLDSLHTSVATTEHVIGIDDRVKKVIDLLGIEDEVGVRIVGVHGANGIGKTTIVKAVYDRLSSCFDRCSFIAEIGETIRNVEDIQFVQTKMMRDILERDGNVASFEGGIKFFLDVFRCIKVLIVLDDVEELPYLDNLVGKQLDWFGSGSRIIVTSENDEILRTYVSQNLARTYKVNKMDNDHALELFRKHALGTHGSIPGYPGIGKCIVKATGQVPFVIEVIGASLCGKTKEDWGKIEDLIKPWKENSREILKICYEALDEKQKQIFWDIAWFANGEDSRIASYMWPDEDLLPSHHVLMPLAKIGGDNTLWMHKLLKCPSGTIDQEETEYFGRRSRRCMHVKYPDEINRQEGMEEVEALCFDLKNHPRAFMETDFKSMPNVGFLKLDHASMTGNFANVFPNLRWLRWQGCPRDFVAIEFSLAKLVILDLSWSKVTEDWRIWSLIKMEQLKVLNLTGCIDLLISPTFCSFPNLEILILERCSQLVHLDPSVGVLKKLLCLNLKSCTEFNKLPDELCALKALKELLIDETSVRIIPLGSDSKELETLSASNCVSLSLPAGVGELVKLRHLSLRNCHWIRKLPDSIGQSPLEELDISGTGIVELPDSFANLQGLRMLKMDHCFISKFPSFIWRLRSLEEIHASSCRNIEGEIPGDIGNLENLRILRFRNSAISSLPPAIKRLSKLETLDVLDCDMLHELPALPSSLVIVHLSPELKKKVFHLWDKHCFITV